MKKAALYVRVSKHTSTTDNQKLRLIEFAERNGYKYDIFEEVESTRKTRPVKQNLLSKLRNHDYDSVIIYKLDRWARSSTELILDTKELVDKSIGFISITDNLDFSTAAGKLQFQILCAFAEFERELIRERTIEGLNRVRNQNKVKLGRPKGSKDKKKRKKSGYILREAQRRQQKESDKGINKSIEAYLN